MNAGLLRPGALGEAAPGTQNRVGKKEKARLTETRNFVILLLKSQQVNLEMINLLEGKSTSERILRWLP